MANVGGSTHLWRVAEAAQLLGISESNLRHTWKEKGPRPHRVGKLLKFMERELAQWLEENWAA